MPSLDPRWHSSVSRFTVRIALLGALVSGAASTLPPSASAYPYECGNIISPGTTDVVSSDALAMLKLAVGADLSGTPGFECEPCFCHPILSGDPKVDKEPLATEALAVFRRAVHLAGELDCHSNIASTPSQPCTPCNGSEDTDQILARLSGSIPSASTDTLGSGNPIFWQCEDGTASDPRVVPITSSVWPTAGVTLADTNTLLSDENWEVSKHLRFELTPKCQCGGGKRFLNSTATGLTVEGIGAGGFSEGLRLKHGAEISGVTFMEQCVAGVVSDDPLHKGTVIAGSTFGPQTCGTCVKFTNGPNLFQNSCTGINGWNAQLTGVSFEGCRIPFSLTDADGEYLLQNVLVDETRRCSDAPDEICTTNGDCSGGTCVDYPCQTATANILRGCMQLQASSISGCDDGLTVRNGEDIFLVAVDLFDNRQTGLTGRRGDILALDRTRVFGNGGDPSASILASGGVVHPEGSGDFEFAKFTFGDVNVAEENCIFGNVAGSVAAEVRNENTKTQQKMQMQNVWWGADFQQESEIPIVGVSKNNVEAVNWLHQAPGGCQ